MNRRQQAGKFERPEIFRPPSERESYFLPLTSGCSNNTCTFCGFYGTKLKMRDVSDAKSEIDALAMFMNHRVCLPDIDNMVYAIASRWDGRRVFLQDGDAAVYPYPKMVEVLEYLNEKFPNLERVGSYATPQDILRRSVAELKKPKELKLSIFYTGVESGDDAVLLKVGKGVNSAQLIEAGRKAKEAGIILSLTVILGLGGVEGSRKHVLETARVLSAIDPEYVGALTLTLVPGTPLWQDCQYGKFHPISPFESLEELKLMIESSSFTDCFFSSMHASNYLSVRGKLPQDKTRMLKELERVLARKDPALLRPEFLRGL
ncbi:MAG: radical SAM protein [Chloroflexi bacterium]|nr:radical SAM protein [Chloroflexota bacterium]